MGESSLRACSSLVVSGFDTQKAAQDTWEALLTSGAFMEGEFSFASGTHATLKVNAEKIYDHPKQLETMIGLFATYPCVADADVLLYVPDGMREFVHILGEVIDKPVANIKRIPSASRYDFMYSSQSSRRLALEADRVFIGEDVVTTLGSVAGVRRLLLPDQSVHSLAMLRRGTVNPAYREGLVDHYLLEREIPTEKEEFQRLLATEWSSR